MPLFKMGERTPPAVDSELCAALLTNAGPQRSLARIVRKMLAGSGQDTCMQEQSWNVVRRNHVHTQWSPFAYVKNYYCRQLEKIVNVG